MTTNVVISCGVSGAQHIPHDIGAFHVNGLRLPVPTNARALSFDWASLAASTYDMIEHCLPPPFTHPCGRACFFSAPEALVIAVPGRRGYELACLCACRRLRSTAATADLQERGRPLQAEEHRGRDPVPQRSAKKAAPTNSPSWKELASWWMLPLLETGVKPPCPRSPMPM